MKAPVRHHSDCAAVFLPERRGGVAVLLRAAVAGCLAAAGSLFAADVPTPEVEVLDSQSVRLTWDEPTTGYILQESDSPSQSGLWHGIAQAPTVFGIQHQLVRSLPSGFERWFFRLRPSGALSGLDFLLATQDASGLWGAGSATSVRDSAFALQALRQYGVGDAAIARGAAALAASPIRNNDDLARQTLLLAGLGYDVSAGLTALLATQNGEVSDASSPSYPGKGWGLAGGFGSSSLDTALVYAASQAGGPAGGLAVGSEGVPAGGSTAAHAFTVVAGASDVVLRVRSVSGATLRFNITPPGSGTLFVDIAPRTTPIDIGPLPSTAGTWTLAVQNSGATAATYSAEVGFSDATGFDYFRLTTPLIYLARAQNPDGGWGVGTGEDSHLMITSEVLRSLAGAGSTFIGPQVLSAGAAWLAGRRNGDGGFSSIPAASNPNETALAMIALRAASPSTPLGTATAYLRSAQQPDGSWGGSPYLTAAVLNALYAPPQVGPIPGQSVVAPDPFALIHLDDFVVDPSYPDSALTWSVTGNSQLNVSQVNRVVTLTYAAGTTPNETLTFTATNPDGLSGATSATFSVSALPPADFTIPRGGNATGSRQFSGASSLLDQAAAYTEQQSGVPAGVTYSTSGVSRVSATGIQIDFQIAVGAGAAPGDHQFQVTYGLLDGSSNPLGPLTGNVFNFLIRITP